jgi:hypothetical protein
MEDNNLESTLQMLENGDASTRAHLKLLRSTNWPQYSVGPMSSWPREMSTILYLLMVAPRPQCLVIGEENVLLYNQAYGKMVRDLHPRIFGQPLDSVQEWRFNGLQMATHRRDAATSVSTHAYPSFVIPMLNHGRLENVHLQLNIAKLPPPMKGFHLCFEETTDCDFLSCVICLKLGARQATCPRYGISSCRVFPKIPRISLSQPYTQQGDLQTYVINKMEVLRRESIILKVLLATLITALFQTHSI